MDLLFNSNKIQPKPSVSIPRISPTIILIQLKTAKDSPPKRKKKPKISLFLIIEWEPVSEHSTRSDRVTNIG